MIQTLTWKYGRVESEWDHRRDCLHILIYPVLSTKNAYCKHVWFKRDQIYKYWDFWRKMGVMVESYILT